MAVTTLDYVPEAGKVLIDDHKGHPGIKATTLSYGQINDDMLEMLEKPHPSYFFFFSVFFLPCYWVLSVFRFRLMSELVSVESATQLHGVFTSPTLFSGSVLVTQAL